jgi:hypothetical protein
MVTANRLSVADRDELRAPLITNDIEKTVAFHRNVLGSKIALAHRLERDDNARRYFLIVAPNTVVAVFEFTDAEPPEFQEATTHKSGRHLDHIRFFVESAEELDGWNRRVVDAAVPVHGYATGSGLLFPDRNNIVVQVRVGKPGPMGCPVHADREQAYSRDGSRTAVSGGDA